MQANFLYILLLVIVLIYIQSNSNWLIPEKILFSIDPRKRVVIVAGKNFIRTDPEKAIMHMKLLKNNLTMLNKFNYKINEVNINQVNELIKRSERDMSEFKTANYFVDQSMRVDSHLEHTLKGSRFDNNISKSDVYSDTLYEKYCMLNLIIDIGIAILLLEQGNYNGYLRLTNIYELISVYSILTKSRPYLSYDDMYGDLDKAAIDPATGKFRDYNLNPFVYEGDGPSFGASDELAIDDDNEYCNKLSKDYGVDNIYNPRYLKYKQQYDMSQINRGVGLLHYAENHAHEEITPEFDPRVSVIKPSRNDNNSSHNTQYLDDSGYSLVVKRNTIPNYIPLCDINKIKTDRERIGKILYDLNARKSLRDDYSF